MKLRLLDLLVCPLDQGPLELVDWEHAARPLDGPAHERASRLGLDPARLEHDVTTGVLVNRRLGIGYPILAGVPRMLVFPTGVADEFRARHGARLARELPGVRLADRDAAPGERDVLRSFSAEWVGFDWTGEAYWNLDPEAWFRCMRWVLELDDKPPGKLALEVGIGVGGVADHVSRETEVVGMDLGHGVDVAERQFAARNPFLHVVQASAFQPPFRDATFDFVYSFGVLHHTYSTFDAFTRVARLPHAGGRLYVWVYSPHDEQRNVLRRALMAAERVVRPIVWRLPGRLQTAAILPLVPAYMAYQKVQTLRGHGRVSYGFREALHAARDRFTPRYIHRHTDEELLGWFQNAGYGALTTTSGRPKPDWVPIAFTACAGVSGRRA